MTDKTKVNTPNEEGPAPVWYEETVTPAATISQAATISPVTDLPVDGGKSGELIEDLKTPPETIFLGQVEVDGKSVKLTLDLYTLGNPQNPKVYFLEADGKDVNYYSKQGNREISERGKGVYSRDDIDIDGNTIYMRDKNNYWLKYTIEKKGKDGVGLTLQEEMKYNPVKPTTIPKTVGKNKDMTLIEYRNPPKRGNIDQNLFKPTEGKLLIIHKYMQGRDKVVDFPQKEGVTFDESTAEIWRGILSIYDTMGNQHTYDINVKNYYELREIDIR